MGADLLGRARGVLYGQCIGDNLGSQVEFMSRAEIAEEYPDGVREMLGGGPHEILAGQPTDDTEMAVDLIGSLVEMGGFDEADVRTRYEMWVSGGAFDVGNTCAAALRWNAPDADSQANGALMRVSPLAVAYSGRPEEAAEFARRDAELTHPNPMTKAANAVYVGALAEVLAGADAKESLRRWLQAEDLAQYLDFRALDRGYTLDNWEDEPPESGAGWVLNALHAVVYHVAQGTDFEEALVQTIALGQDTDTNAAIVGAFLGGIVGEDGIPARWRETVDSVEQPLAYNRPARYVPRVHEWARALTSLA